MSRTLPASWVLIPCPHCDGEGYTLQLEVGGYFDLLQETWYPWEKFSQCRDCQGTGQLEVSYDLDEHDPTGQEEWERAA